MPHPVIEPPDLPLPGKGATAERLRQPAALGRSRPVRHEKADLLLKVFTRTPPEALSVARREGLA